MPDWKTLRVLRLRIQSMTALALLPPPVVEPDATEAFEGIVEDVLSLSR